MNNELQKQWEQDVADYGDNAYLMWELLGTVTIRLTSNKAMLSWIKEKPDLLKRKDSAELPFNIERAIAGDEILAIDEEGKIHRAIYQGYYEETSGIIIGLPDSDNERAANVHKSSLRMKYPHKVKP